MMDLIASRGYDVYLVDIRGYGGSTRPPEMNLPAAENKPIVHTDVAVHDFGAAVDHILEQAQGLEARCHGLVMGHLDSRRLYEHA